MTRAQSAAMAALVLGLGGCSSSQLNTLNKTLAKGETLAADILITDQQEARIGEQIHEELEKQGIQYVRDPLITRYVQDIAQPIFRQASQQRPGVEWHVHVIDKPDAVNAFATPGGHIYVYSGTLLLTDSDAELAGVLAHEAGHILARHAARMLVTAFGLQAVSRMALGENPGLLKELASALARKGAMLAYSRRAETEADEWGAKVSDAAGFDPNGLVRFLKELKAKEPRIPSALVWLMDHPLTRDRIQHLRNYIDERDLEGGKAGTARLAAVKKRIEASS